MKRLLTSLTCLLSLITMHASAQSQGNVFIEDSTIKVWAYGHQNGLAWCGGFTNPQFAMGDLNNDGKPDLVIFEPHAPNFIRTFINTGTPGAPNYVYSPHFADAFPYCNNFLKLEDYNRDGIPDLITRGNDGFTVYRGSWSAANELKFTLYKSLRFNVVNNGNINAYTQYIPGVVDADGDGDLDFFSYDVNGFTISYYKNCQVEHGLPKDSIEVCWPTTCWGNMVQGNYRSMILGIIPGSISCDMTGTFGCKGTMHGGNNILVFDYDGDGDMDILGGNFSFNDIQLLINGKHQYNMSIDSMISQDTLWQRNGHQFSMPTFPAAFYVDYDNDGKKDLLISSQAYAGGENYKCIAEYRNTGTAAAPVFTWVSDSVIVDHSIDVGTASYPLLYDYNKDGRLDLIVGSDGYSQPNGVLRSKISYYQNTLVGGVTQLVLQTTDLAGTFAQDFSGAAPAVGDLDGDGIDDLVLGHADGTLSFYKNMAASQNVTPQWQLNQVLMTAGNGDTIRVGNNAAPCIYDINKDGKKDLLIGNMAGKVFYYQNNATGGNTNLQQASNSLGALIANPLNPFAGYATLSIGKMDNTGKDYILMGNDEGVVKRYDGFQSGNTNLAYNLIDTNYSRIHAGSRSAITVGDIDGDGKYDMIIGNTHGGLQLFRQSYNVTGGSSVPGMFSSTIHCSLYPNPARNLEFLTWDSAFASEGDVSMHITNVNGQTVWNGSFAAKLQNGIADLSSVAAGTYFAMITAGDQRYTAKFTIVR